MNVKIRHQIERRKRRIARRLDKKDCRGCDRPAMTASNVQYEIADRTRATAHGGIGAMHMLVQRLGLPEAIDERLGLLKIHLPYHDSDHVLNIARVPLACQCSSDCCLQPWRATNVSQDPLPNRKKKRGRRSFVWITRPDFLFSSNVAPR